ncbi:MAG TPA: c-type cytochrome [Gaiella sp.]|nr:c-type cytochrome [Gaiella sp.]
MERSLSTTLRRRPMQVGALALLALVAGLFLAACGDTVGYTDAASGDTIRGKELFKQGCGSCHTLNDAGTTGTIGPNLDYAFLQSRKDGLGEDTIIQVVRDQMAYAVTQPSTGAPGMPRDIFTGQDADDVATYVASVAGLDASGQIIDPANPPKPGGGGGNATDGKTIFATAGCTGCHTLEAAGSTGTVGPNLDEAKPPKELVIDRVTNGQGGMPSFKGQLSEAQIQAVATYVSENAGK